MSRISSRALTLALLASSSLSLLPSVAAAYDGSGPGYLVYDGGAGLLNPADQEISPTLGASGGVGPTSGPIPFIPGPVPPSATASPGGVVIPPANSNAQVALSFEGLSQYDTRALNGGYSSIPPDTMGAVGASQFMETTNGGYAVYSKTTGALQGSISDGAFWTAAGQPQGTLPNGLPAANGDARVMYDATSQRWIAESFGASTSVIQIAVSDTSNALGSWRSTSFTGFAGGIADYPTLAIDSKAIYIGTNDFASSASGGAFQGTTLNVIARNDLFGASAPAVTSLKQFFTPYTTVGSGCAAGVAPCTVTSPDRGYAIQGVNQVGGSDSGKIVAIGVSHFGEVAYDVTNPGTAGAAQTPITLIDQTPYDNNNYARQPYTTGVGPTRTIDPLDDRVSSAAWEQNGKIYTSHTITPVGSDHTAIQWVITDAASGAVIQEGMISDGQDDFYQSSIVVNDEGQVVIGYDRSGSESPAGKVSFYAETFNPLAGGDGAIGATGDFLIKVSDTDSYHNGSLDGQAATGRQRWGDYSQVTVDPNDDESFWAIGEFAREPNDAANGHVGGTGGTRWGTFITDIDLTAVPEPTTWAMMLVGVGLIGGVARRRARATLAV